MYNVRFRKSLFVDFIWILTWLVRPYADAMRWYMVNMFSGLTLGAISISNMHLAGDSVS